MGDPIRTSPAPFSCVLVANRGEIACRIIETLRRLGIRSVAVHSAEDDDARHVALADVAVRLGPPGPRDAAGSFGTAAQTYLDVDAVIAAAAATGAEAIHPGYGFLSENPELARACERAGIVFVGPSTYALEAMADKLAAKDLVAARGVPVVPGTSGRLDDDGLVAAASDVGFPLLVKPSAGGGGKGMQVVRGAADLPAALASARRVAAASFGDDTLLLERLVETPRHIEVQVLADSHGAVVHLGERECSLQRRHQKVVEEAPSPLLDDVTRARMGAAAVEVARSVDYRGAGTVEFLVPAGDPDEFFFIEMNTRLQVEHPVTEMVTGLDLVELQLRVAAGEPLGLVQEDVVLRGHAIEARVYAESPARGFLPATGTVLALAHPLDGTTGVGAGNGVGAVGCAGASTGQGTEDGTAGGREGMRLDSSLVPGLRVGGSYDPLLAKAVAHGEDRAQALARLDTLLAETVVLGVETSIGFLRDLLAAPDVRAGNLDTGLIDRLVAPSATPPDAEHVVTARRPEQTGRGGMVDGHQGGLDETRAVVAAALTVLLADERAAGGLTGAPGRAPLPDPAGAERRGPGQDPWRATDGWRLNAPPEPRQVVLVDATGAERTVSVVGTARDAVVHAGAATPTAVVDGRPGNGGTAEAGAADAQVPGRSRRRALHASLVADPARPGAHRLTVDGASEPVRVAIDAGASDGPAGRSEDGGRTVWVWRDGRTHAFDVPTRAERVARTLAARRRAAGTGPAAAPELRAAMPGTVVAVVPDGEQVAVGDVVVTVEAMKMEHPLTAPHAGTVQVHVRPGDLVRRDQVVAVVHTDETRENAVETQENPADGTHTVPAAADHTGERPRTAPTAPSDTRGAS